MTEQKKSLNYLDAVKVLVEALEKFNDEERGRVIRSAFEIMGSKYAIGENLVGQTKSEKVDEDSPVRLPVSGRTINIKTFVENKNPKNDKHFAAVVAYFHQFEAPGKKESITKDDLVEATRLADWDRLKRPDQTLVNAANSGLLDSVTGTRGHYRLNSVGENLVAMVLPNEEGKKPKRRIVRKKIVPKKKNKK